MNDYIRRASLTLIIILGIVVFAISQVEQPETPIKAPVEAVSGQTVEIVADIPLNPAQATFEDLLDAIEWVESRGDANAVGDWTEWEEIPFELDGSLKISGDGMLVTQLRNINGKNVRRDARAIGAYQIWEIYVRDANRILGWDKYTYEDRRDRDKSREMTAIVIQHYGKGDIETMARAHKCPPERYKESTKPYWAKVKARLEE